MFMTDGIGLLPLSSLAPYTRPCDYDSAILKGQAGRYHLPRGYDSRQLRVPMAMSLIAALLHHFQIFADPILDVGPGSFFAGILLYSVFPPDCGFAFSGASAVDFCLEYFALRLTSCWTLAS